MSITFASSFKLGIVGTKPSVRIPPDSFLNEPLKPKLSLNTIEAYSHQLTTKTIPENGNSLALIHRKNGNFFRQGIVESQHAHFDLHKAGEWHICEHIKDFHFRAGAENSP